MTRSVVIGSFLLASALASGLAAPHTPPPSQGTKPARQATRPAGAQQRATAGGAYSRFVNGAAEGGMKAFAQRMVTDHGKANDELVSLASATQKGADDAAQLAGLKGAKFDRA